MKVGILDILCLPSARPADPAYHRIMTKQYSSITPQAIAVWCRELGHDVFYANYYGIGDPRRRIPADVDFLFVSTYTQPAALAYALAKLYRRSGATTVIGGAHARSFPADCLRFFDYVVRDCDKPLIGDLLARRFDPGHRISSAGPYADVPTVEERLPEIRASAFMGGRRRVFTSTVPMLASMGCPYACNFCVDWNTPYRLLSTERLVEDLRFLSENLPGAMLGFHDPNFAMKFDPVLDALETVPPGSRPPYLIESSLSILKAPQLARLKRTNCAVVAPGIESWEDYSNKAGLRRSGVGLAKVEKLVEHFHRIAEAVPYQQANLMIGLDGDAGREPVELTKEFISRTPSVWPAINVPIPFGGTPLFDAWRADGRIHTAMPFAFYYSPYLVTTFKNYDPAHFYRMLIELTEHLSSPGLLLRRLRSASPLLARTVHLARTVGAWGDVKTYQRMLGRLEEDPSFRRFHEGRSSALPDFYRGEFDRLLGPYAPLLSDAERTPDLEQECPTQGFQGAGAGATWFSAAS
jgi:hypothetical protein